MLNTTLNLQNAEITFNFGQKDFKFPPKGGYIAVCEASKECTVHGGMKVAGDKPQKIQNNAPQAVIIEVRELKPTKHGGMFFSYIIPCDVTELIIYMKPP